MARLLRKLAIIGFIAMNSPLLAGKPDGADEPAAIDTIVAAMQPPLRAAAGHLSASREAAQILAGLDPEMRERVLGAATNAAARPAHR